MHKESFWQSILNGHMPGIINASYTSDDNSLGDFPSDYFLSSPTGGGGGYGGASYNDTGGGGSIGSFGGGGRGGSIGRTGSPSSKVITGPGGKPIRVPHFSVGDVAGAVGTGLEGNAFVKAQRAGFANELKDPKFRAQFGAMLMAEGPTLGTAESAYNRAAATGHSLHDMVTGSLGRRFYSTYGKYIGATRLSPKMDALINNSLMSDSIHGATDQGMWNDPNGPGRQARKFGHPLWYTHQNGNYYGDWHAIDSATGRNKFTDWRENFESHANAAQHTDSAVIPPSHGGEHSTTVAPVHIDGREIMKIVFKHGAKEANKPAAGGARMPDHWGTMPLRI